MQGQTTAITSSNYQKVAVTALGAGGGMANHARIMGVVCPLLAIIQNVSIEETKSNRSYSSNSLTSEAVMVGGTTGIVKREDKNGSCRNRIGAGTRLWQQERRYGTIWWKIANTYNELHDTRDYQQKEKLQALVCQVNKAAYRATTKRILTEQYLEMQMKQRRHIRRPQHLSAYEEFQLLTRLHTKARVISTSIKQPHRPLSAYNLFFKEERQRILAQDAAGHVRWRWHCSR